MRASTGIKNLDEIVNGGYLERSFNLVYGAGGTGKTLFTMNFLLSGAERGEDVLYVSLEESWDDITHKIPEGMRQRLSKVKSKFHYLDFGSLRPILGKEVLQAEVLIEAITSSIMVHRVKLVGIDGIAPLSMFYEDSRRVRSAIFDLSQNLKSYGVTTVFTSEEVNGLSRYGVEEYVADSVIRLVYDGRVRRLLILKMRGANFIGGAHGFEILNNRLEVYPRRMALKAHREITAEGLDIPKLDVMMGEIYGGDVVLITGPPGTGKSIFGLHFIKGACDRNDRAVFISFESDVPKMKRKMKEMGGNMERCSFFYVDPVGIDLYKLLWKVKGVTENTKRVVIQGVNTIARNPEYHEFIHELLQYLKRSGITTMITYTIPQIISNNTLGDDSVAYLADDIINLRFAEINGELKKILVIIKSHAPTHDRGLIEYRIGRRGIVIVGRIEEMEGVMSGTPTRQVEIKKRVEKFFK
ncbi:MAG: AAA family ATPase [Euryarchaeota archaeon]|nr:AAA family ATPase [Euryarchaeota archaeon]